MRSIGELENCLANPDPGIAPHEQAARYLQIGEEVLENWLVAHDKEPTSDKKEGFRILALQRQGSKGDPSFNACRETCRELVYHYNLIEKPPAGADLNQTLKMAGLVANHLVLFVGGKLENAGLGEFCCSSKGLRLEENNALTGVQHG